MTLTKERLTELGEELQFLDLCELILAFSRKTAMSIRWSNGRVTIAIKAVKKVRKEEG